MNLHIMAHWGQQHPKKELSHLISINMNGKITTQLSVMHITEVLPDEETGTPDVFVYKHVYSNSHQ